MQTDAERTLGNLHVLGALSHNDKLMTNDDAFDIYAPTSFRAVFRMLYGERRAGNITRVKQAVRAGFAFANAAHDDATTLCARTGGEDERMQLRVSRLVVQHLRMCEGLFRAKAGLDHLLLTYRDDSASSSSVQLLMAEIDDFFSVMAPHTTRLRQRVSAAHDAGTGGYGGMPPLPWATEGASEVGGSEVVVLGAAAAPLAPPPSLTSSLAR